MKPMKPFDSWIWNNRIGDNSNRTTGADSFGKAVLLQAGAFRGVRGLSQKTSYSSHGQDQSAVLDFKQEQRVFQMLIG